MYVQGWSTDTIMAQTLQLPKMGTTQLRKPNTIMYSA